MISLRQMTALLGAIATILALHYFFRHTTASLVIAPIGIAFLLATIKPTPVGFIVFFTSISELLSTLPLGTMIVVFAIPFIVLWALKLPEVDITWKFFFVVAISVFLQIAILLIAKNGLHVPLLQEIPIGIISLQLACTSVALYAVTIAYHEYTSRI